MHKVAQKYLSSSADDLVVLMDSQENTVEAARGHWVWILRPSESFTSVKLGKLFFLP